MLNSSEKTNFCVEPSWDLRVIALLGVSGSMRPVRIFFNNGSFSFPAIQSGLFVQGVTSSLVTECTKVLHLVSLELGEWARSDIQYRIPDEQYKQS